MTEFYELTVKTVAGRPSYHNITDDIKDFTVKSKIKNGICAIHTPHTTCSLYYEENMHDCNYFGDEYLQVDINNVMDRLVPKCTTESQYNSPGPKHIEFGLGLSDPDYPAQKWTMLNTDAHIRASLFGSNAQILIIKAGELLLGRLGRVYFVDWDQNRERVRTCNLIVMGE